MLEIVLNGSHLPTTGTPTLGLKIFNPHIPLINQKKREPSGLQLHLWVASQAKSEN